MMLDLPHIGRWNTDRIVRVTAHRAKWQCWPEPKVLRDYVWWGKPRRNTEARWYQPACIRVWTGSDYGDNVRFGCKPSEPERWRDDVLAAIAAAQAGEVPERIVAAAIRRLEANKAAVGAADAAVWMTYTQEAPARHHHILHSMPAQEGETFIGPHQQGFITSTGRWVDRKTAMGIALAAGQVAPEKVRMPDLFSEDLW